MVSYGDGYGRVEDHVNRIADLGMGALALTEHGNVSSWVQLERCCRAKEIKPIFGIEAYTAPEFQTRKCHMILLAMNTVGLQNLNRIVTESYKTLGTTSKSKFPTVHWPVLKEFNNGLITLSGCADSFLSCILLGGKSYGPKRLELQNGDLERGIKVARLYQKVFGDRYYLEVQRFSGLDRTCILNPALQEISSNTGIPLVATSDVHYPYPNQNSMQKILHAAHRGGSIESVEQDWEYNIILSYPLSDNEIQEDLLNTGLTKRAAAGAILNTARIADRCNVELPKAKPLKYVAYQQDWREW